MSISYYLEVDLWSFTRLLRPSPSVRSAPWDFNRQKSSPTWICDVGMITLTLLLVMVTSVFFGFRQKGEILVVPVATLFAFTQLRTSMPGAPDGFGERPCWSRGTVRIQLRFSLLGDILGEILHSAHSKADGSWLLTAQFADFVGLLPCLAILSLSVRFL